MICKSLCLVLFLVVVFQAVAFAGPSAVAVVDEFDQPMKSGGNDQQREPAEAYMLRNLSDSERQAYAEEKDRRRNDFISRNWRYMKAGRSFDFLYAGAGAGSTEITQAGTRSSVKTYAYTGGLEFNSPTRSTGLEISMHNVGGNDSGAGEIQAMVYYRMPFGFPDRFRSLEEISGEKEPFSMSKREFFTKHGADWAEFLDQYPRLITEIGFGYGGVALDQKNGTQLLGNGQQMHAITRAQVAGIPVALRLIWYGDGIMVRLGGEYPLSSAAKIGVKTTDDLTGLGIGGEPITYEVATKGHYFDLKLDIYDRLDGRIASSNALWSGIGLTLAYRQGHVDGGSFPVGLLSGGSSSISMPALQFRQVELLFKTGIMR